MNDINQVCTSKKIKPKIKINQTTKKKNRINTVHEIQIATIYLHY